MARRSTGGGEVEAEPAQRRRPGGGGDTEEEEGVKEAGNGELRDTGLGGLQTTATGDETGHGGRHRICSGATMWRRRRCEERENEAEEAGESEEDGPPKRRRAWV